MNKQEFLDGLSSGCCALPEEELRRTLDYYSEMIEDGVEAGQSEEAAVAALGEPEEIAARLCEAVGETRELPAGRGEIFVTGEALRLIEIRSLTDDVTLAPAADGVCRLVWDEAVSDWDFSLRDGALLAVQREKAGLRGLAGLLHRLSGGKATLYLPLGDCEELKINAAGGDLCVPEGWRFARAALCASSGDLMFDSRADALRLETRSGDIRAAYPAGETLAVSALSGDVELRGQHLASLQVETASGDLNLTDVGAEELSLRSMSGDLALAHVTVTGKLALEVKSGDVDLRESSAEELVIRAVSGDIELAHCRAFGSASLKTVNGDIGLRSFDARDMRIETTHGDVCAELLSGKRFSVHTQLGDVSLPDSDPAGGLCEIRTTYGDVAIRVI